MSNSAYWAIIPASVRYDKSIDANCKMLFLEISALTNETGYCWASNQFFADFFEVDIRTIQRWMVQLSKAKHIFIEQKKEGMKTERKIWLYERDKKMFTKRQKCHEGMTNLSPTHDKFVTQISISNKDKEYIHSADAPSVSVSSSKAKEEKIKVAEKVELTEAEASHLLIKLEGNVEARAEWYEKLSLYKQSTGKKYANDYATILNWMKKEEKKNLSNPLPLNLDKELALKIGAKYANHPYIRFGGNYIEFIFGQKVDHIKMGENGFRERVENNLRKMNLKL